jgi:hypothetical protein
MNQMSSKSADLAPAVGLGSDPVVAVGSGVAVAAVVGVSVAVGDTSVMVALASAAAEGAGSVAVVSAWPAALGVEVSIPACPQLVASSAIRMHRAIDRRVRLGRLG